MAAPRPSAETPPTPQSFTSPAPGVREVSYTLPPSPALQAFEVMVKLPRSADIPANTAALATALQALFSARLGSPGTIPPDTHLFLDPITTTTLRNSASKDVLLHARGSCAPALWSRVVEVLSPHGSVCLTDPFPTDVLFIWQGMSKQLVKAINPPMVWFTDPPTIASMLDAAGITAHSHTFLTNAIGTKDVSRLLLTVAVPDGATNVGVREVRWRDTASGQVHTTRLDPIVPRFAAAPTPQQPQHPAAARPTSAAVGGSRVSLRAGPTVATTSRKRPALGSPVKAAATPRVPQASPALAPQQPSPQQPSTAAPSPMHTSGHTVGGASAGT